jgi:TonB family protein
MKCFMVIIWSAVVVFVSGCSKSAEKQVVVSTSPDSNLIARLRELELPDEVPADSCSRSGFKLDGDVTVSDIVEFYFPAYPVVRGQSEPPIATIVIEFIVNPEGDVLQDMIIQRSSDYPKWDDFLKGVLLKWKFKPSEKENREASITFRFVPRR